MTTTITILFLTLAFVALIWAAYQKPDR